MPVPGVSTLDARPEAVFVASAGGAATSEGAGIVDAAGAVAAAEALARAGAAASGADDPALAVESFAQAAIARQEAATKKASSCMTRPLARRAPVSANFALPAHR